MLLFCSIDFSIFSRFYNTIMYSIKPYFSLRFLLFIILFSSSCNNKKETKEEGPLFTLLPSEETGVDFQNTLTEGLNTNILMYEYFYNGGGVGLGDFNNDELIDIYFSGKMQSDRL